MRLFSVQAKAPGLGLLKLKKTGETFQCCRDIEVA